MSAQVGRCAYFIKLFFLLDAIPVGFGDFGVGTGLIFLSEVACTGTEDTLASCPGSPIGQNFCVHRQDAGVICMGKNLT